MRKKVDVLLVEDNEDHIFLTKKALELFDESLLNVHVVTDGVQAIAFVEKQPPHEKAPTPDLILLDIKLPNKNGFDVLTNLKSNARHKSLPIVMLTSSDAEQDIKKSYELGSNSYITKPIKTDELFKKLKNIPLYWFRTCAVPPKAG